MWSDAARGEQAAIGAQKGSGAQEAPRKEAPKEGRERVEREEESKGEGENEENRERRERVEENRKKRERGEERRRKSVTRGEAEEEEEGQVTVAEAIKLSTKNSTGVLGIDKIRFGRVKRGKKKFRAGPDSALSILALVGMVAVFFGVLFVLHKQQQRRILNGLATEKGLDERGVNRYRHCPSL
eukprot:287213-Prorocentrum_minimum.AAC.1